MDSAVIIQAMTDRLTLERLGYLDLLELAAAQAASEPGANFIRAIRPFSSLNDALERQAILSELRDLSDRGRPLPLAPFTDIAPLMARLKPADAVLPAAGLFAILPVLENAETVTGHLAGDELHPGLARLAGRLVPMPTLRRAIHRSVSPDGKILDAASERLADIRRRIRTTESLLRKRLEEMLREPEIEKYLQDDFITSRSGRFVIPVRRDFQSRIPGIVHDLSNSGETAFIEPLEILPLGNELGALAAEERAEEIRIMRELSTRCREASDEILETLRALAELDGLRALARLAEAFRMVRPQISAGGGLKIVGGRHPILLHFLIKQGREPVPLDLALDGRDLRAIVITGPNTGGKTVALKTVGLLCLMANAGMHVTAGEGTALPHLRVVAADIGDDQSIEQSLSTFSAHMKRAAELFRQAGPGSLLIFDELGAGTDPEEGGPLACAILEAAVEQGGLVLASTHLGAVKGFVHRLPHARNAAVQFDERTLAPTYRLETGVPGQSHALDIASRYGLPESVVAASRTMRGTEGARLDALIRDLSAARRAADEELENARAGRERAAALEAELKREKDGLQRKRREILHAATLEAAEIVRAARSEAEDLLKALRAIRPGGSAIDHRKEARKIEERLEEKARELRSQAEALAESTFRPIPPEQLKQGSPYHVRSLNRDAVLVKLSPKTGRARVSAGGIEVEVPVSELGLPEKEQAAAGTGAVHYSMNVDESVGLELNLVGKRVDPALEELGRYLDRVGRSGLSEIRIIHGLGTGTLSRAVRNFLSVHPLVADYGFADLNSGGEAVTVAKIRRL